MVEMLVRVVTDNLVKNRVKLSKVLQMEMKNVKAMKIGRGDWQGRVTKTAGGETRDGAR